MESFRPEFIQQYSSPLVSSSEENSLVLKTLGNSDGNSKSSAQYFSALKKAADHLGDSLVPEVAKTVLIATCRVRFFFWDFKGIDSPAFPFRRNSAC
jgi:hypothetical protein